MQGSSEIKYFDVLVVGAGAAGMMAAREIAATGKSVAVVEALDRTGGRMFTIDDPDFDAPVDLGAEFVHGNLPLTKQLLQQAGARLYEVEGSIWQQKNGQFHQQEDFIEDYDGLIQQLESVKEDIPVAAFIDQYLQGSPFEELRFTLKNYVEGYYAADTDKASTTALYEELTMGEEEDFRIEGGYRLLTQYLEQQCRAAGVQFLLAHPVKEVYWEKGAVEVVTAKDKFRALKALITVSIGVLQSDSISFHPALPRKKEAACALGFGHVLKVNLQFAEPFWKVHMHTGGQDLGNLCFLFSEEAVPTWWTHYPHHEHMITGWLAGPKSLHYRTYSKEAIVQEALGSLSRIFHISEEQLQQKLIGADFFNWSDSPYFNGAYSYEVVNGSTYMQTILQPEEDTLYFAGEGLNKGPQIGTVEAALSSGKEVAAKLIEALK